MKHTETHKFRRGQKLHLDSIYNIQGLGCEPERGGAWWEHTDGDGLHGPGDNITITRDITITITVSSPNTDSQTKSLISKPTTH